MVGGSGCGKTSYMGAAFHKFSKPLGFNGFSISMEDIHAKNALSELGRNVVAGIYPPGDSGRNEYSFVLRFKGQDYVRFNWHDYRGGVLSSGLKQDQVEKYDLLGEFKSADALIVFFDATEMLKDDNWQYEKYIELIGRTLNRIVCAADGGMPIPVSLVFTKVDQIGSFRAFKKRSLYRKFSEEVLDIVKDSECLQTLLVTTEIGVKRLFFFRQTRNVEYPFLHSLVHIIKKRQSEFKTNQRDCTQLAESFEPSILDSIRSMFTGEESERQKRKKALLEAERWAAIAREMNSAIARIDVFLRFRTRCDAAASKTFRYRV